MRFLTPALFCCALFSAQAQAACVPATGAMPNAIESNTNMTYVNLEKHIMVNVYGSDLARLAALSGSRTNLPPEADKVMVCEMRETPDPHCVNGSNGTVCLLR